MQGLGKACGGQGLEDIGQMPVGGHAEFAVRTVRINNVVTQRDGLGNKVPIWGIAFRIVQHITRKITQNVADVLQDFQVDGRLIDGEGERHERWVP